MNYMLGIHSNNESDRGKMAVQVRALDACLEIVVISGLNKNFKLYEVIGILEEEGAEVITASFSKVEDKIVHIIHSQVSFPPPVVSLEPILPLVASYRSIPYAAFVPKLSPSFSVTGDLIVEITSQAEETRMEDDIGSPPLRLVNFIFEKQLDNAKKTRGLRVEDGSAQQDRPLYEENKDKKDAEFNERFKHSEF
ncbi:hypothetical protein J5N97_019509 [Dioscorea zingiberensis]|uniref:Uncharacterized protein n=1 Tax=Dioscorea zingiberensis TaxID=325984 RepID=A0A9D5HCR5_9LILI|nr:hypothetical protein J5N97_019509 [Dioscorea zingiberensis]